MAYKIRLIILSILLFFGTNVAHTLGVDIKMIYAILIGISILFIVDRTKEVASNKALSFLLFWVVAYSLYKLTNDLSEGARMAALQILGAPIIYAAFPKLNYRLSSKNVYLWRNMTKIFFYFFMVEVTIVILERLVGHAFFRMVDSSMLIANYDAGSFRSGGLLGHPLYNSLVISVMMSFILVSRLNLKLRLILWFLGFLAILCLNGRSSIVGNLLIFISFILYTIFVDKTTKNKDRRLLIGSFIVFGLIAFVGVKTMDLGGRLFEMGLFDDSSAQVRVDIWSIFNYFDLNDFLFGLSFKDREMILYSSGLFTTENFWIDQMFQFGLIFLVIYVYLYVKIISVILKGYTKFNTLIVVSTFVLIASTNNSLSSSFLALCIFLFLCHIFDPKYIRYIVPQKYLENIVSW